MGYILSSKAAEQDRLGGNSWDEQFKSIIIVLLALTGAGSFVFGELLEGAAITGVRCSSFTGDAEKEWQLPLHA